MTLEIAHDLIGVGIHAASLALSVPSKSREKVLLILSLVGDIYSDFDESAKLAPRTISTLSECLAAQNGMLSYTGDRT